VISTLCGSHRKVRKGFPGTLGGYFTGRADLGRAPRFHTGSIVAIQAARHSMSENMVPCLADNRSADGPICSTALVLVRHFLGAHSTVKKRGALILLELSQPIRRPRQPPTQHQIYAALLGQSSSSLRSPAIRSTESMSNWRVSRSRSAKANAASNGPPIDIAPSAVFSPRK
jgi:hypothetical protein